jgi:hypothetical protein
VYNFFSTIALRLSREVSKFKALPKMEVEQAQGTVSNPYLIVVYESNLAENESN